VSGAREAGLGLEPRPVHGAVPGLRATEDEREKAFDPVTLVRSPTLTNSASSPMVTASRPESFITGETAGTLRGVAPSILLAMAEMCSGVVPQQPPARLTKVSGDNDSRRYMRKATKTPKAATETETAINPHSRAWDA